MLNAYPLKLPNLSEQLISDIFNLYQNIDTESLFDPKVNFNKFEINQTDQYHKATNTTWSKYKGLSLNVNINKKIKKELKNSIFPVQHLNFYLQIVIGGTALGPHIDSNRILNLLLNISNDDAITSFYDQLVEGKRNLFALDEISDPIETHQFEYNQWYIFNNQKIHGVTNITKPRLAIAANLDMRYIDFYNQYKDTLIGAPRETRTPTPK